ncbi:MAG: hypothetical protein Q8P41_07430 [Pseudomonadota bacterium]|nr:hypothetical protein [Pseudomonadota bacterium]
MEPLTIGLLAAGGTLLAGLVAGAIYRCCRRDPPPEVLDEAVADVEEDPLLRRALDAAPNPEAAIDILVDAPALLAAIEHVPDAPPPLAWNEGSPALVAAAQGAIAVATDPAEAAFLGAVRALGADGGRTADNLRAVRDALVALPAERREANQGAYDALAGAVEIELRGTYYLERVEERLGTLNGGGGRVNDAQNNPQRTTNCAMVSIAAMFAVRGSQVRGIMGAATQGPGAFPAYATAQGIEPGEGPEALAAHQIAGMRAAIGAILAAIQGNERLALDEFVLQHIQPAGFAQVISRMKRYPLGARFCVYYQGHWNFAALTPGGQVVFRDYQQDVLDQQMAAMGAGVDDGEGIDRDRALVGGPAPIPALGGAWIPMGSEVHVLAVHARA